MRKTLRREAVVERANVGLARITSMAISGEMSWDEARVARTYICAMLEGILNDHNAYAGFGYLVTEFQEDGTLRPNHDDLARRYY